jgi:hypothetical protein
LDRDFYTVDQHRYQKLLSDLERGFDRTTAAYSFASERKGAERKTLFFIRFLSPIQPLLAAAKRINLFRVNDRPGTFPA